MHLAGVGPQQVLHFIGVGDARVEPAVIVFGGENDRHPVVQGRHQFIGRGGEDGAAQEFVFVKVIKSGKTDRFPVWKLDIVRRLGFSLAPPLEKSICRDEAAPVA